MLINYLHTLQANTNTSLEEIRLALEELTKYTVEHFSTEEKYMDQYQDFNSELHKNEHQEFIQRVEDFKQNFSVGKQNLTLEILEFLKGWLINHTLNIDIKMAEHICKQQNKSETEPFRHLV